MNSFSKGFLTSLGVALLIMVSACSHKNAQQNADNDQILENEAKTLKEISSNNYDDLETLYNDSSGRRMRVATTETSRAPAAAAPPIESQIERSPQGFFKGRFATSSKICKVHKKPSAKSAVVSNLKSGKKVWVDPVQRGWVQISLKSSTAFAPTNCF